MPFLPEVIGVVTSPSGAVLQDILHRLAERCPRRVLLWPVLVQGEHAAAQVAAAIEGFNRLAPHGPVPRPDVLIVARAALVEDLWPFNEEVVVRAAAASAIPLISAVGHEADGAIDHAADQRAPRRPRRPSSRCRSAPSSRNAWASSISACSTGLSASCAGLEQRVLGLARGLPDPVGLLGQAAQRLDGMAERLPHGLRARIERAGRELRAARPGSVRRRRRCCATARPS